MQTSTEIPGEKAVWHRRRRTTRRAVLGFTLLFAAFFASALWLNYSDYEQWLQQNAQYQQDCKKPITNSSNCQVLTVQVVGHRTEGDEDSSEWHNWFSLRGKSGQKFEVDDWQHLSIGDSVNVLVWNGEVEEVDNGSGTVKVATNPSIRAEAKRGYFAALWIVASIWLCLIVPLTFVSADKLHKRSWMQKSGNNPAP